MRQSSTGLRAIAATGAALALSAGIILSANAQSAAPAPAPGSRRESWRRRPFADKAGHRDAQGGVHLDRKLLPSAWRRRQGDRAL